MNKTFLQSKNLKRKRGQYSIGENKKNFVDSNEANAKPLHVLKKLKSCFNNVTFVSKIPPIIFQHQLYSFIENRTICDKEVTSLCNNGEIRIFKMGMGEYNSCIVFTKDFVEHVSEMNKNTEYEATVQKFLREVIQETNKTDVSINEDEVKNHGFKDTDVTVLIKCGLLTVRDAGSWWLAIPRMGYFIKIYTKGKQSFMRTINATMKKEMLLTELLSRKSPKSVLLGYYYHAHDAIGSATINAVNTTSGILLKIPK